VPPKLTLEWCANRPRRLHESTPANAQHFGAGDASGFHPADESDEQHESWNRRLQDGTEYHEERKSWDAEHRICKAHERRVEGATHVASERTNRDA
jgi:hypothetical protein